MGPEHNLANVANRRLHARGLVHQVDAVMVRRDCEFDRTGDRTEPSSVDRLQCDVHHIGGAPAVA